MLHIHFHLCKCGDIFCCFGSRDLESALPVPAKLPDQPDSGSNVLNRTLMPTESPLIQMQPQRQGAMELPIIQCRTGTMAEPTPTSTATSTSTSTATATATSTSPSTPTATATA